MKVVIITVGLFFLANNTLCAQEIFSVDSLEYTLPETATPELRTHNYFDLYEPLGKSKLSPTFFHRLALPDNFHHPLQINVTDLRIYNPNSKPGSVFYRRNNFTIAPIGIHYQHSIEGGDIVGVSGTVKISKKLSGTVTSYYSSAYMGIGQPNRVENFSTHLNLDFKLTDWLTLRGFGQYSIGSGINPAYSPVVGSANSFGGAARIMFTEQFGIEAGMIRSYYNGNWTNFYYVAPVIQIDQKSAIRISTSPFQNFTPFRLSD